MNGMIVALGKQAAGGAEVPVPSKALAIEGQEPREGDKVSFTVDGVVTRVVEGKTFVRPSAVNGMPVQREKTEEETDQEMRDLAMQHDREAGMNMEDY